ncbi:alcohol dehydrogenase catalytic domain-containing protein [candidate division KSB1 bacterium]|nr:alcohol dehydrogenase catalytic domain-containing protein [candidate division KSB1 bacterium]
MKAIKLHTLQDIRLEEIPIPEIGDDEALVRMKACGICGSDTMDWYVEKKAPFYPGHEPAGIIEEVGSEVSEFKVGDRVFVHHHAPCFDCKFCRKKQYSLCPTWKAAKIDPGGLAEYFRVPAVNLRGDTLKLPDALSFEDGSLIEPTACVVKSFRKAGLKSGATILAIGLGVMGQMHILLGRHIGARQIIGADLVPYRLEKAQEFGADAVINVASEDLIEKVKSLTRGQMADLVIIGPPSIKAMAAGLSCVGKGGTALFFTPTPDNKFLQINPFHLYFNEINLIFSYSCGPNDTREALELIEQGVITAEKLVTHKYPLDKAKEAHDKTIEAGESLKTLVVN